MYVYIVHLWYDIQVSWGRGPALTRWMNPEVIWRYGIWWPRCAGSKRISPHLGVIPPVSHWWATTPVLPSLTYCLFRQSLKVTTKWICSISARNISSLLHISLCLIIRPIYSSLPCVLLYNCDICVSIYVYVCDFDLWTKLPVRSPIKTVSFMISDTWNHILPLLC